MSLLTAKLLILFDNSMPLRYNCVICPNIFIMTIFFLSRYKKYFIAIKKSFYRDRNVYMFVLAFFCVLLECE